MAPTKKTVAPASAATNTPLIMQNSEAVLFRGPKEKWGVFSTWYAESDGFFKIDDNVFQSVEQCMQAGKASLFGDDDLFQQILKASGPKECKQLGSTVSAFEDSAWESAWPNLLLTATHAKFSQNVHLQKILLSTGTRAIGLANAKSGNWGIGIDVGDANAFDLQRWSENRVGQALMRTRSLIANDKNAAVDESFGLNKSQAEPVASTFGEVENSGKVPCMGCVSVRVVDLAGQDVFGPVEVPKTYTVSNILTRVLATTRRGTSRGKLVHNTSMLEDASSLPMVPHGEELRMSIVYLAPLQKEDFAVSAHQNQHDGRSWHTICHTPTSSTLTLRGSAAIHNSWGRWHYYQNLEVCEIDDGVQAEYERVDYWDMPTAEENGIVDEREIQAYNEKHKARRAKLRYKLDIVDGKGLVWGPCVWNEPLQE